MTIFFSAAGTSGNTELWISDGTQSGTTLLKDINASSGSFPRLFFQVGAQIFFGAVTTTEAFELWVTDGTGPGTHLVEDILPGNLPSSPKGFAAFGDKLVFSARTGDASSQIFTADKNRELWISDGTEAGTYQVADIAAGDENSNPSGMTELGGRLVFAATNTDGDRELWSTDGTSSGTVLLKNIASDAGKSSDPSDLTRIGDKIVFSATNAANGRELWITDGTTAGTQLVKDIFTGSTSGQPNSSSPSAFTVLGSKVLFMATDAAGGREPWVSDGTASGTFRLVDTVSGGSTSTSRFTTVGDVAYFFAMNTINDSTTPFQLWKTDGTVVGTSLVFSMPRGPVNSTLSGIYAFGDKIVFTANDGVHGTELWISDGTTSGTLMLKDIDVGPIGGVGFQLASDVAVSGDKFYFSANNGIDGKELWVSDGTSSGTVMLKDLTGDANSSTPSNFFALLDNQAPTNITLSNTTVREFGATGIDVGTLSAVDSSGGSFTYALLNSAGGRFKITGNVLEVSNGLLCDYEQDATHTVQVRVTDSGGLSFTKSLNVTLTNVNPEFITGNSLANTLWGGTLSDKFDGAGGNDVLRGYNGNDTLNGGLGNDTLSGGANNDVFVFNKALSSTANKDIITDFGTAGTNNDTIKLDNAVFNKLIQSSSSAGVTLLAKYFTKNATGAATSLDQRIIYETDTGLLRYDPDGNKAGGAGAIIFADLAGSLTLSNADFFVI